MKLLSLTVLSVSALSALVSASPLVSKREAAASSDSERRLIQLRYKKKGINVFRSHSSSII